MFSTLLMFLFATAAESHYYFPSVIYNGTEAGKFEYTRDFFNLGHYKEFPVQDVKSDDMTCNVVAPKPWNYKVLDVTAGMNITFTTVGLYDGNGVFHNGPMQYWLAKVPTGTDINDFEAKGNDWFKIYHDEPYVTEYFLNNGKRVAFWQWLDNLNKVRHTVTIPICIENGEYLLRIEHIGLETGGVVGGAQFYISCTQLRVSGGTGTAKPSKVAIPGAYDPYDPAILDVPMFTTMAATASDLLLIYKPPLGDALKC